jgi:hypothetical protein
VNAKCGGQDLKKATSPLGKMTRPQDEAPGAEIKGAEIKPRQ